MTKLLFSHIKQNPPLLLLQSCAFFTMGHAQSLSVLFKVMVVVFEERILTIPTSKLSPQLSLASRTLPLLHQASSFSGLFLQLHRSHHC